MLFIILFLYQVVALTHSPSNAGHSTTKGTDRPIFRKTFWANNCGRQFAWTCQIGTQGPCDVGQSFSAIPEKSVYNLDDVSIDCQSEIETKLRFTDADKPPANCKTYPDEQNFVGNDIRNAIGYCVWTKKDHPCRGFPSTYVFVKERNQCLFPSRELSTSLCKKNQIVQKQGNGGDWKCVCEGLFEVIWPRNQLCYRINEQGPCQKGEWIEIDDKGHLVCRPTPCPADGFHIKVVSPVTKNVTCYKEGLQGPCPEGTLITRGSLNSFKCEGPVVQSGVAIAPTRTCNPGEMLDSNGNCRKSFGR